MQAVEKSLENNPELFNERSAVQAVEKSTIAANIGKIT